MVVNCLDWLYQLDFLIGNFSLLNELYVKDISNWKYGPFFTFIENPFIDKFIKFFHANRYHIYDIL